MRRFLLILLPIYLFLTPCTSQALFAKKNHAQDDGAVPIANSENLKKALEAKNVPVKLVVYDKGSHGFGMRKRNIPADNWPEELRSWMKEMGII